LVEAICPKTQADSHKPSRFMAESEFLRPFHHLLFHASQGENALSFDNAKKKKKTIP
jgi:hypothetical protein